MCLVETRTYIHHDGRREKVQKLRLCTFASGDRPCGQLVYENSGERIVQEAEPTPSPSKKRKKAVVIHQTRDDRPKRVYFKPEVVVDLNIPFLGKARRKHHRSSGKHSTPIIETSSPPSSPRIIEDMHAPSSPQDYDETIPRIHHRRRKQGDSGSSATSDTYPPTLPPLRPRVTIPNPIAIDRTTNISSPGISRLRSPRTATPSPHDSGYASPTRPSRPPMMDDPMDRDRQREAIPRLERERRVRQDRRREERDRAARLAEEERQARLERERPLDRERQREEQRRQDRERERARARRAEESRAQRARLEEREREEERARARAVEAEYAAMAAERRAADLRERQERQERHDRRERERERERDRRFADRELYADDRDPRSPRSPRSPYGPYSSRSPYDAAGFPQSPRRAWRRTPVDLHQPRMPDDLYERGRRVIEAERARGAAGRLDEAMGRMGLEDEYERYGDTYYDDGARGRRRGGGW
ncbi:hypothetical protein M8818_003578 [Zalaria obscura]|uniref:Uncharacterized protein n=1 Tax=Zalaria obscura TaxID=2024903 RepID=A0ACC3SE48_9PEZI